LDLKSILLAYFNKIDKITSLKDTNKLSKRKYKVGITKIYGKISNIINDMHWKTSNFLCKKFNNICIGKLNTRNIVLNEKSNINELNKRLLYSISHYRFRII
jgi:transposase